MRIAALAVAYLISATASAHVTVWPRQAELGAHEKYVVRVPNEKQVATVRIDATFPPQLRVMSFQDVPGWTLQTKRDASGQLTGASWTGTLPAERFIEFPLIAINPKEGERLSWSFVQHYADGSTVEWAGAPGSKSPASVVTLVPAADASHHH